MKKKSITIAIAAIAVTCILIVAFTISGNQGNTNNVNRITGYSALYNEKLINKAFDTIEKKFASDFKGCTLTELRYDEEVENRFAEQINEYNTENNQELLIVLSTFDTESKGGDGSLNPNDTYTNWQWHLVRTEDDVGWEIINWGY